MNASPVSPQPRSQLMPLVNLDSSSNSYLAESQRLVGDCATMNSPTTQPRKSFQDLVIAAEMSEVYASPSHASHVKIENGKAQKQRDRPHPYALPQHSIVLDLDAKLFEPTSLLPLIHDALKLSQRPVSPTHKKLSPQIHNLTLTSPSPSQPKQFKCLTCNATFTRLHDLKRHSLIHETFREHVCGKCGKGFSRKDALSRHAKGADGTGCKGWGHEGSSSDGERHLDMHAMPFHQTSKNVVQPLMHANQQLMQTQPPQMNIQTQQQPFRTIAMKRDQPTVPDLLHQIQHLNKELYARDARIRQLETERAILRDS